MAPSAAPGLAFSAERTKELPAATQGYDIDVESQEEVPLMPHMSQTESQLRWGFCLKVFSIVGCQLVLTAVMAALIMFNKPVQNLVLTNLPLQIIFMLAPFVMLIPLWIWKDRHPLNLALLAVFTLFMSVSVGAACSAYAPFIVLEAVVLTAAIVGALTAYSFHASKKGVDFSFMGPLLFAGLWAMVVWGFLQIFFQPGPIAHTIYALLGSFLFSAYIVYDIQLLIARLSLDDYIWASVNLYLDVINLFLYILQLLGRHQRN